jgi:hypothetical protein
MPRNKIKNPIRNKSDRVFIYRKIGYFNASKTVSDTFKTVP